MFHTELWRGEDKFSVHIFLTTKVIRRLMKNVDLPRPRHRMKLRVWMFKLRFDTQAMIIFMFLRGIEFQTSQ
jgi:hypothetical protein